MGEQVIRLLRPAGFKAKANTAFDWIHDTYLILVRMFPKACPPTTIVSMNARYDPHFHIAIGSALRPMRLEKEKVLFIGSGGAVHNLYRNCWTQMLLHRDNFAMENPPDAKMLDFRQEFEDAVTKNSGPALRRNMAMLMKLPNYRDAHGTDDHFMAALFVAGLLGEEEDVGTKAVLGAEDWELQNMCNSQYTFGSW